MNNSRWKKCGKQNSHEFFFDCLLMIWIFECMIQWVLFLSRQNSCALCALYICCCCCDYFIIHSFNIWSAAHICKCHIYTHTHTHINYLLRIWVRVSERISREWVELRNKRTGRKFPCTLSTDQKRRRNISVGWRRKKRNKIRCLKRYVLNVGHVPFVSLNGWPRENKMWILYKRARTHIQTRIWCSVVF